MIQNQLYFGRIAKPTTEMKLQTGECSGLTLLRTFFIVVQLLFVTVYSLPDHTTKIQFKPVVSEINAFKRTNPL